MKYIELTQGKQTAVDDEDFEYLSQWSWHLSCHGYAARSQKKKPNMVFMHRVINCTPPNYITDHINRDKLDNRRRNLRTATLSQNAANSKVMNRNTSGHRGVHWSNREKRWIAKIMVNGKPIFLGQRKTISEANNLYRKAYTSYFGEFARE